jgi:hypothetical protein
VKISIAMEELTTTEVFAHTVADQEKYQIHFIELEHVVLQQENVLATHFEYNFIIFELILFK